MGRSAWHGLLQFAAWLPLACTNAGEDREPPRAPELDLGALAVARHGQRIEELDGALYMFGGFAGTSDAEERGMRAVFRFDVASGRWQPRAPLVTARAFTGSAVLDGALYAVSGDVERYDVARDAWEVVLPDAGLPDSHFACARVGSRVYVLGGYPAERSGFHAYDASTNSVETLPAPPGFEPTDHFAFLFTLDEELHQVGGLDATDFTPTSQHHVYAAGAWTERAPPPIPLWAKFSASGVVGRSFFVFAEGRGLRYDAPTDTWSDVAPCPEVLVMPACIARDGRLLVIGGEPLDGSSTPRAATYDPTLDVWRSVP